MLVQHKEIKYLSVSQVVIGPGQRSSRSTYVTNSCDCNQLLIAVFFFNQMDSFIRLQQVIIGISFLDLDPESRSHPSKNIKGNIAIVCPSNCYCLHQIHHFQPHLSQQGHQPPSPPESGFHGGIYLAAAQGRCPLITISLKSLGAHTFGQTGSDLSYHLEFIPIPPDLSMCSNTEKERLNPATSWPDVLQLHSILVVTVTGTDRFLRGTDHICICAVVVLGMNVCISLRLRLCLPHRNR